MTGNRYFPAAVSVAVLITSVSAAAGVFFAIKKFVDDKEKAEIAQELSVTVLNHLHAKGYFEPQEIVRVVDVEQKLLNYFERKTMEQLHYLKKITATQLLNEYF
ncbi:MAG: hypothetical protein COA79_20320 [Planctomycetota bacterium]|nr:MAG: hypothetical protein COA79_20320 [Planctomycetota bacterium]